MPIADYPHRTNVLGIHFAQSERLVSRCNVNERAARKSMQGSRKGGNIYVFHRNATFTLYCAGFCGDYFLDMRYENNWLVQWTMKTKIRQHTLQWTSQTFTEPKTQRQKIDSEIKNHHHVQDVGHNLSLELGSSQYVSVFAPPLLLLPPTTSIMKRRP
jgi:hypothetical protein